MHNKTAFLTDGATATGTSTPPQCFLADTLVSTEYGQIPIQTIQKGDRVWACDHVTGEWKLRPVLQFSETEHDGSIVLLTIADDLIQVTPGHPFWVIEGQGLAGRPRPEHVGPLVEGSCIPGRWVDAGKLQIGDRMLLQRGKSAAIIDIARRLVREKVYNFQVAELHSYAVGKNQILVHNKTAFVDPGQSSALQTTYRRFSRLPTNSLVWGIFRRRYRRRGCCWRCLNRGVDKQAS